MQSKVDRYVVVAIVLCLVVFAGEYLTYSGSHSYDVSAEVSGDTIGYGVSSSGVDVYSAVVLDNGGRPELDELAILADEHYDEHYDEAAAGSDLEYLDQGYYADQIRNGLENRSFYNVRVCNTGEALDYLQSTLDDPSAKGLLVLTYALPSEIYSGDESDLLLRWMEAGGSLYWLGSEVGAYYTEDGALHAVEDNEALFLGEGGKINTDGPGTATSVVGNGLTEALSLKSSGLRFGLDVSGIEGALAIGYGADGFSTISFVPHEGGFLCVIAGGFDVDLIDDVSQTIASGLTPSSSIVSSETGEVHRGTTEGEMPLGDGDTLYVYIGGTYTKYAEAFHV